MGDTAKAVVGIGLIAVGAGALGVGFLAGTSVAVGVGATLGAYGAVALFAGVGAMVLAGASLVGGAFTPEIPDMSDVGSYAGQVLQTRKTNVAPVPICYGRNRVAGNIVWETTGNQVTANSDTEGKNRDYWAIISLCGHDIGSVNGFYAGTELLTDRATNHATNEQVGAKLFYTSGGINLQSVVFPTNDGTATQTGSSLGFPSIVLPENMTYLAVHQIYSASKGTQMQNITVDFYGKPVRTIGQSGFGATSYDATNVEVVADALTQLLGVDDSAIDFDSFYQSKQASISNGLSDCSLALVQQANIQSVLSDVMAGGRLSLARSEGKWVIHADSKGITPLKTLDEAELIAGATSISMAGNNDIANSITVNWQNPADEWLKADYTISDAQLIDNDGREINKSLDIKSVINESQAQKIAEITLNSMRYTEDESGNRIKQTPLVINFATTTKHSDIEVGDVIAIDHFLLERVRKFVVLSVETDQSGIVSFSGREYCETHYKDANGNYII